MFKEARCPFFISIKQIEQQKHKSTCIFVQGLNYIYKTPTDVLTQKRIDVLIQVILSGSLVASLQGVEDSGTNTQVDHHDTHQHQQTSRFHPHFRPSRAIETRLSHTH